MTEADRMTIGLPFLPRVDSRQAIKQLIQFAKRREKNIFSHAHLM